MLEENQNIDQICMKIPLKKAQNSKQLRMAKEQLNNNNYL